DSHRLQVALAFGADATIEADRENVAEKVVALTEGRGVDIALDAAGGPDTLVQAIRAAKKNGKVFFAAAPAAMHPDFHASDVLAHLEVSTSFEHFIFREAELGAIWSLIDFALNGETDAAQREDLVQLRCATVQAYESLGNKRPREAVHAASAAFSGGKNDRD